MAPLSNGVQTGIRVPVILIALAGVVLALVGIRRLGVGAAVLGALGSLFIAVDQIVTIVWVLHLSSIAKNTDSDIDTLNTANNAYTIADAVLITIGAALVVAALVVRRGAPQATVPPFPPQPYAAPPPYGPPQPYAAPSPYGSPQQLPYGGPPTPPPPGMPPQGMPPQ
jgi:hypothetical protein